MIGCTEYLEMMNAFMDGELDEESRAERRAPGYCPDVLTHLWHISRSSNSGR